MTLIVTGAAGCIGCNIVIAPNAPGSTDLVHVDNLTHRHNFNDMADCPLEP